MRIRTRIGAVLLATALFSSVGATAAQASYQTGHLIKGPTKAACQTSLNNAYNSYTRAGRVVTHISNCVSTAGVDGSRFFQGAIYIRNY